MQLEVVISGFGGQGSLFAGQLLAYAPWTCRHVTWIHRTARRWGYGALYSRHLR
jgi:hypothetical protein